MDSVVIIYSGEFQSTAQIKERDLQLRKEITLWKESDYI